MITIKLIGITVVLVLGLKVAMSEGMLLENLGKFFERKIEDGKKIYDLFFCEWCSSTLQTITAHGFAFGLWIIPFEWNWQLLIRYPLVVMASSFIAGNLWNLYLTTNKIKEKNEVETEYYKALMGQPEEKNNN
jgi:hypothetical protein